MYKVSVNQTPEVEVTQNEGQFFINDKAVDFDSVANSDGTYHVLLNGNSHQIEVLENTAEGMTLKINKQ